MTTSRGYTIMADIVIAIAAQPMTAKQAVAIFADRIKLGPMRRMLRRLLDGRVLRISDWVGDRNAERVYAVGSEPSMPAPTKPRLNGTVPRPLRAPQSPAVPMYFADRFCRIWECLETPCTVAEICEEIGSPASVIRPLLNKLRLARPKLVRIVGYERNTHRAVIYQRGGKQDAGRPPRMSEHESYVRAKQRREALELHRAFGFFPQAA